jgi:hypothetical protein
MVLEDIILANYGGLERNNLLDTLHLNMTEMDNIDFIVPSPYYSPDSFSENLGESLNKFTILSLNCQSIRAKFNNLIVLIETLNDKKFKFDAICLQETWLGEDADLSLYQIPNYVCISQGKHCSEHGGLVIYLHKNYNFEPYVIGNMSEIWEGLFIKILNNGKGKHIFLGNIYRPPKDNTTNEIVQTFIDEIDPIVTDLNKSKSTIVLAGDFNIDLLKLQQRPIFRDYLETFISLGLCPTLTLPTRITDTTATLIDNVYSNYHDSSSQSGIIISEISDHYPCFYSFQNSKNYIKPQKLIPSRKCNDNNIKKIYCELESANIMDLLNHDDNTDPNINYNILEHILITALDKHMPIKQWKFHKHKNKKSKWITQGIIRSIKFRDNLYKRMKETPCNTIEYLNMKQNLTTYNRILKRSIRQAKLNFYQNKFHECKSDSKETWYVINEVINKAERKHTPDYMIINNHKISDKAILSNNFNEYFSKIGTNMAESIENPQHISYDKYLTNTFNTRFHFKNIDENQTEKIIKQLNAKSSYGHDGISTNLLKKLSPILIKPLTLIINQSLHNGIFPDNFKISKIVPIHKKNNIHLVDNYRPISLLPSISKIFEKIVFEQLYTYFDGNKYLCQSQYGFRKMHSTEHAILEAVNRICLDLDKGNTPLAVFLDLSKAFDTLNHDILLNKLQYYGVRNSELNWFKTYLTERQQYVELDHIKSDTSQISVGVPQGSILGPLLFIIYINDIKNSTQFFEFIKYADDTNLLNSMTTLTGRDTCLINNELEKVFTWLCVNKLSLNIAKTKFMLFHNARKNVDILIPSLRLNGIDIERVDNFNFLGVTLDENMNWHSHVNKVAMKLSRGLGILYKLRHIFPLYILRTLYNSLTLPHLTYGILAWGKNTKRLFQLQKRAIRLVANSNYRAHTSPLFKYLNILKLDDIFTLTALKFYFSYCNNRLPSYFQTMELVQRQECHNYNVRYKQRMHTVKIKTKMGENSLFFIIPRIVNVTVPAILDKIMSHSLHGFNCYVKQCFINSYDEHCNIQHCYICNR